MQELMDRRVVHLLGGNLQPAELAQAIARCMDDHQRTSSAVPIAPDRFRALVNPDDCVDLHLLDPNIEHRLSAYAVELARERGFNFQAPPEVFLVADGELARGALRVEGAFSSLVEHPSWSRPAWQRPRNRSGYQPPRADALGRHTEDAGGPSEAPLYLEMPKSQDEVVRLPLDHFPFVIGRREGSDLVLPDEHVSRHHASIERVDNRYRVRDLSSRNGTHLNGEPIIEADLSDGDRLSIGTFEVVVRIAAARYAAAPGAGV